jgi:hypothetical protein
MKTKTGLLALGLITLSGVVVVSCGGSSDDTSNNPTAGTTSTTAGTTSTTGGNTSAGTTSNTSGTATNTSGTANNNGGNTTGGTANGGNTNGGRNQGGRNNGGNQNAGGDPGNNNNGGAAADGCPAAMPADGSMCTQAQSGVQGCDYGDMNCRCRRAQGGGNMRTWQCMDAIGAGGAGNGFPMATCPANAQDGDPCTGTGLCPGQQCFCAQAMTNCF